MSELVRLVCFFSRTILTSHKRLDSLIQNMVHLPYSNSEQPAETTFIFKPLQVAFKGGFVCRSVCLYKFFKKFSKRDFVNPIDTSLVSIYVSIY